MSEKRIIKVGASPVSAGRYTYGLNNLTIMQWGEGAGLHIGAFCSLASSITIFLGGNHRVDWMTTYPFGHIFKDEFGVEPIKGHPATHGDVVIGNDVWIGHGVTIMSGVTIGDGAVLATNATVTKPVAPYDIVGGNPAKPIKKRFDDETIALLLELRWWELPIEDVRALIPALCAAPAVETLRALVARYRSAG